MKKTLITCLLFASTVAFGQKNAVKLILAPVNLITANNVGLAYERKMTDRFSVGLKFNFSSKSAAPLSDVLSEFAQEQLDSANANSNIFNNKFTSSGLTLELRYYPKAKALKGFYLAPYIGLQNGSLANFDFDFPDSDNPAITHGGNVEMNFNFIGGGIGIGNQWTVKDRIAIDILWFGFGVGSNNFQLTGTELPGETVNFPAVEQQVEDYIAAQEDGVYKTLLQQVETSSDEESIKLSARNLVPYTKFLNFSIGFSF